jgi:hypothetical protein
MEINHLQKQVLPVASNTKYTKCEASSSSIKMASTVIWSLHRTMRQLAKTNPAKQRFSRYKNS